jgi:hypothetical protein
MEQMTGTEHAVSGAVSPTDFWRVQLEAIYQRRNPHKLKNVAVLLERYRGCEALLYRKVCLHYDLDPLRFYTDRAAWGEEAEDDVEGRQEDCNAVRLTSEGINGQRAIRPDSPSTDGQQTTALVIESGVSMDIPAAKETAYPFAFRFHHDGSAPTLRALMPCEREMPRERGLKRSAWMPVWEEVHNGHTEEEEEEEEEEEGEDHEEGAEGSGQEYLGGSSRLRRRRASPRTLAGRRMVRAKRTLVKTETALPLGPRDADARFSSATSLQVDLICSPPQRRRRLDRTEAAPTRGIAAF